jgi:hypothetical protein
VIHPLISSSGDTKMEAAAGRCDAFCYICLQHDLRYLSQEMLTLTFIKSAGYSLQCWTRLPGLMSTSKYLYIRFTILHSLLSL